MGLTPGDDVLVTTIGPALAAVQICADIEFPEINRLLARRGVELRAVPVAHVEHARRPSGAVRRARAGDGEPALRRHVPAGRAARASRPDGAIHGTGYAMVTGPIDRRSGLDDGVVVAHPDTRTEGMVVADLDFELIAQSRAEPEPPGLSNIRPDLYAAVRGRAGASGPVRTALTEQFGITHPIVSAGMARVAQAPLVAAVSEAGGLGCLGGVSYFADALRDEMRADPPRHQPAVRRQPARAPVAGPGRRRVVGAGAAPVGGPLPRRSRDAARRRADAHPRCRARPGRGRARRAAGGGGPHVRRARLVRRPLAASATSRSWRSSAPCRAPCRPTGPEPTSSSPRGPRGVATPATSAPWSSRRPWSTPWRRPSWRRAASSTGAVWPPCAASAPRARGWAPASSPPPRPTGIPPTSSG